MNEKIAVIDTETTWSNRLMSIGVVLADSSSFEMTGKRYYIIPSAKKQGGMFADVLYINGIMPDMECPRNEIFDDLRDFLAHNNVRKIFAYNAAFDYGHLKELQHFEWFDIMKIAAYRQYNKSIPECADCFRTGRLKRGFGVENIYRMLSGDMSYYETHNALFDAADELAIMKMLALDISQYGAAKL